MTIVSARRRSESNKECCRTLTTGIRVMVNSVVMTA